MNELNKDFNLTMLRLKETCFTIAVQAHQGQPDKANQPYILHPLTVSAALTHPPTQSVLKRFVPFLSEEEKMLAQCIALLHDVIEDTSVTYDDLISKYQLPKNIADAVLLLTKTEDEDYFLYLKRVKVNKLARVVKLSDLLHNSDLSRLKRIKEKDIQRRLKYLKAMLYLWD